jgi:hypothetical protein
MLLGSNGLEISGVNLAGFAVFHILDVTDEVGAVVPD